MPTLEPAWLVADLGATNLRFGLAAPGMAGRPLLTRVKSLRACDFGSFAEAAASYVSDAGEPVQGAVVSVAGRVVGGTARITNLSWTVAAAELAQALRLERVHLVNDLGAAAAALPALGEAVAPRLWPRAAVARPAGPRRCVVIGPGTGLGIAGALIDGHAVRVLDTEGGHTAYAPENEHEDALLQTLRARFGRVSWEHVVSGPGLMNLHAALTARVGEMPAYSPEEILARAAGGCDRRSQLAASLFADALAAVAGDAVLKQGAWDGVYLVGSLALATRAWIERDSFRARFVAKGPFAEAMAAVPVHLVTHPHPVLLGAACIALDLSATTSHSSTAERSSSSGNDYMANSCAVSNRVNVFIA